MVEVYIESRDEIVEKVRRLVAKLGDIGFEITAVYLYGSHATGDAHSDSDIDIAIVSPDLSGDRVEDWCWLNKFSRRIDVRMEVIGFRPEQFRDEHPLAWEIKTKEIKLI